MSQAKLILSQSPPPWVPLRFFVTAPVFAILAAILIIWYGADSFVSRWSVPVLATTHLLVLGFMSMVMMGALIQVVSVLIGGKIKHINMMSILIHSTLCVGVLLLASGFILQNIMAMQGAVLFLGISFAAFIYIIIRAVLNRSTKRDSGIGIGLAIISLIITVLLGLWLAVGYGWDGVQLARSFTDTHLIWGLLGWVGILVITVAYEVVPMFQLTPPYPKLVTRLLVPIHIIALVLWSGWIVAPDSMLPRIGGIVLALSLSLFAFLTIWLQIKRKKIQADGVVWFWRSGMLSVLIVICLWSYGQVSTEFSQQPSHEMLLGILFLLGFAVGVINGMLYKIIPFLVWLHLSVKVTEFKVSRRMVPNIKKVIPDDMARLQFWFHLATLLMFVLAVFLPNWFLLPAALIFAISNALLLRNLLQALQLYSRTEAEIVTAGAQA